MEWRCHYCVIFALIFSLQSYCDKYREYDPMLVSPSPSNPWITGDTTLWTLDKSLYANSSVALLVLTEFLIWRPFTYLYLFWALYHTSLAVLSTHVCIKLRSGASPSMTCWVTWLDVTSLRPTASPSLTLKMWGSGKLVGISSPCHLELSVDLFNLFMSKSVIQWN